jgi:arsenate reductase
MAEGILRKLGGDRFEVESAGTEPSRVHPLAIKAMAKYQIDISGHRSKALNEFLGERLFDYVITVCDSASESCPVFPGGPERIHWSIQDPSTAKGSEAERFMAFRRTAEELMTRIRYLIAVAERNSSGPH